MRRRRWGVGRALAVALLLCLAAHHTDANSNSKKKDSKEKDKDKGKGKDIDKGIDLNFSREQGAHSVDRSPQAICERHRQKLQMSFDLWLQTHHALPKKEIDERKLKFAEELAATSSCEYQYPVYADGAEAVAQSHAEFRAQRRGSEHMLPKMGEDGKFTDSIVQGITMKNGLEEDDLTVKDMAAGAGAGGVVHELFGTSAPTSAFKVDRREMDKKTHGDSGAMRDMGRETSLYKHYVVDGKTRDYPALGKGVQQALIPGMGKDHEVRDVFMNAVYGGEVLMVWTDVPTWRVKHSDKHHADGQIACIKGRTGEDDGTHRLCLPAPPSLTSTRASTPVRAAQDG